jgi:carbamoyl-phosphate synthase large subunit
MNVLISGVGSDIGFGIARILKEWGVFSCLHVIDIHEDHAGVFVFDKFSIAPRATDVNYIPWLTDYIRDNNIDCFIPSSEAEIFALAEVGLNEIAGAKILRNTNFTVRNTLDKHTCLGYLRDCGIAVPDSGVLDANLPSHYPVILKPRQGQGSKGIRIAREPADIINCQPGMVWQDYLLPDDEEYTCPIYASPKLGLRILIIKRKLMGGLTGSGVVVDNPQIEAYVRKIAEAIQVRGAVNVQLRLTGRGPLLFEINPRLSSTLVFRDKMGFTDLRWWVADLLDLDVAEYEPPASGTRFYRGAYEYISKN